VSEQSERADRLGQLVTERALDLVLVTNLVNVRYLCGFSGTNGLCLVGPQERLFVTDFRYYERVRNEVFGFELVRGERDLLGDVAELVASRRGESLRLGFEDASMSVARHARLSELLPDGVELVPSSGLVERLRAVKDAGELEAMSRAAEAADRLYRWLVEEHGLAGCSEREVARALERRASDEGVDDVAFPPIVAAAANGALPHAAPGDEPIPTGALVVVDLGCMLGGYCSDCTRTFATGPVEGEAREVYELVRSAQAAALGAVRAGADVRRVDAAAREPIERAGHGEQFGHGTGHGVGLEVHEQPRLAPTAEGTLERGNVVTIEPGIYVPGRFGVRIEDLVAVGEQDGEVMTSMPKELITV
jgi:Xaa-Pro aminopeptidase